MEDEVKKIFYDYCYELKKEIEELILEENICARDDPEKKKESCIDDVLAAIINTKLGIEEIQEIKKVIQEGNAIDLDFFFNNPTNKPPWEFIHKDIKDLARNLFRKTPKGFGTPNAAPGEGELMFCILHPDIRKPTRGDICIRYNEEDHIFELKGDLPRVSSNVLGSEFRLRTLEIAKEYNIEPNECRAGNVETAVEIEKSSYNQHYMEELNKIELNIRRDFIWKWLLSTGGIFNDEDKEVILNNILEEGIFNQKNLQKEIIKGFFRYMCRNEDFESMILLGDGDNIKIIQKDPVKFGKMVDENFIEINSDYFRVAQPYRLGWYIG